MSVSPQSNATLGTKLELDDRRRQLLESRMMGSTITSPSSTSLPPYSGLASPNPEPPSLPLPEPIPEAADALNMSGSGTGAPTEVAEVPEPSRGAQPDDETSSETSNSKEIHGVSLSNPAAPIESSSSRGKGMEREKENRKRVLEQTAVDIDASNSRASVEDHYDLNKGSHPVVKNTMLKYLKNAASLSLSPPGHNQPRVSSASVPSSAAAASNAKNSAKDASAAALIEYRREIESQRIARDQAESKVARLEDEVRQTSELRERNASLTKSLEDIYRSNARQEMRRRRDRLAQDCVRLGKFRLEAGGLTSGGSAAIEYWEEGYALKEWRQRKMDLEKLREELETRRKKLLSRKGLAKKVAGDLGDTWDHDIATEGDAIRLHVEELKREEGSLHDELRLLESEKEVHKKELRRISCEDRSRFVHDLPCLSNRYILTSILGKGGFSEVWRAFDLNDRRDVAIKVHQLNTNWSQSQKDAYIKHVTREYEIHRSMKVHILNLPSLELGNITHSFFSMPALYLFWMYSRSTITALPQ